MKILKKIAAGLLAAAVAVAAIPIAAIPIQANAAEGNSLRLWYDEPASGGTNILSAGQNYSDSDGSNTWQQQTLPIGNGDMGANVYGEIQTEHLTFNEKTLWTGGPSESRTDYMGGNLEDSGQNGAIMQQVQQLFLDGDSTTASSLCGTYLIGTSDGYGSYQPWGDIYFDFADITTDVTDYQRDLDLTTGISTVSFTEAGSSYSREYFISHDDDVLVAHLEVDGAATMNLDVRFESKQGGTTVAEGNTLILCGEVSDNQLQYASYLTVVTDSGTVTAGDGILTVAGATELTVFLSAATDYANTFYNEDGTEDYYYRTGETAEELAARVSAVVEAAVASGYDAVKASHLADYQELFSRVDLDLGQGVSDKTTDQLLAAYKAGSAAVEEQRQLEVMLFQYGRYLTIASSREDSQLPSNLQGVWNFLTSPPWGSDYHMNVNLQMNYWPTYSTNLAECAMPLIDYVDSLREPGRITAAIYAGVSSAEGEENGFTAHTQNTPFGWTCPGWSFDWGWSPAAVPWILQNCWEYYEYTGDVEFMEEYIYPMLKEEAKFYDATLVRNEDGELVSAPSYSPEHGPRTAGNTYEQSLTWQLYEDAITAAETLGVDAELVETWKANQADLKGPIEVGESGQLKEWYEETTIDSMDSQGADADGHRHISQMLGLFPGDLVQQNEEWIAAAKYSMEYRTDESTGWAMAQRINTWARLGEGDKAHELIQNLFAGGIYPNLWDAHAPFQIDGNFGMTSGVAEMLVQSNMGYINLLPALPSAWAEGSVDGLVARGNFEISMDWTKGGVTNATILSNNGGEAVILADNIAQAAVTDRQGNAVTTTTTDDGMISFSTTAGETYTVTIPERPDAPANLTATRETLTEVSLTWDAVDGATYSVYRQSGTAEAELLTSGLTENTYTDTAPDTESDTVTYLVTATVDGVESVTSDGATLSKPLTYGMVDDRDSRIIYEGAWANWDEDVNYDGTIKYLQGDANVVETATVTLQFIGTGIEVYTCTNYDRGMMEIFIDGTSYGSVDTYSASTTRQVKIFTEDELEYGLHTLVIVPLGQKNDSSSGVKLELDAFNILDAVATAPDEVDVALDAGDNAEYTDETGYYVDTDTSALDENVATVTLTGTVTTTGNVLGEKVTAIESGKTYLIVNTRAAKILNNTAASAAAAAGAGSGLSLNGTTADISSATIWTIEGSDGTYTAKDPNGSYLTIGSTTAGVSATAASLSFAYGGTTWTIAQDSAYLNDFGGAGTCAAGWADSSAAADVGSQWDIYEVTAATSGTTTITFYGTGAGETSVQIGNVVYNVTVTGDLQDVALEIGETKTLTIEGETHTEGTVVDSSIVTLDSVTGNEASKEFVEITDATAFDGTKQYIIVSERSETEGLLTGDVYEATISWSSLAITGLNTHATVSTDTTELWTITANDDGTYAFVHDGQYLTVDYDSSANTSTASLTDTATGLNLALTDGYWYITNAEGEYLSNPGGFVNGYYGAAGFNETGGSGWKIHELVSTEAATQITVTGVAAGTTTVKVGDHAYRITVSAPDHEHVYDQQIVSDEYLASAGTCDAAATYYYSCSVCGEAGTETFTYGETGHTYENGFCTSCDGYEAATADDAGVYQITNGGQLYWFAALVNGGQVDADAILTQDITINPGTFAASGTYTAASGETCRSWTPMGSATAKYAGTFDGNGMTITGLYQNQTGTDAADSYVGLIGFLGADGVVQNVTIAGSYFYGNCYVGAVVADNAGQVIDCTNSSYVGSSDYNCGGVVGSNAGTVTGCTNSGTITSTGSSVGGVIGHSDGTVARCVNTGSVTSSYEYIGGVVGSNAGTINGCSNSAAITGGSDVGGIAGYSTGNVTGSSNAGSIDGNSNLGGIVGFARCNVTYSNNSGAIGTAASYPSYVGGIVGLGGNDPAAHISVCYNTGTITGCSQIGGIAGQIGGTAAQGNESIAIYMNVEDCYNTGNLVGVRKPGQYSSQMGGVVGYVYNAESGIADSYSNGTITAVGTSAKYIGGVAGRSDGTIENCFYLTGSAVDGKSKAQLGIGSSKAGSTTADVDGATTGKTAAELASGEVTYLLNHSTSEGNLVWKQTIGTDASPKFEGGTVYFYEETGTYTNEGCSHTTVEVVRENEVAATCQQEGSYDSVTYCTTCGEEIARETVTVPVTDHSYENGVCTVCGISQGVAYNTATETAYATVAEALEAAEAGQTVILLTDCTATNVLVTPGVTLDLNGKNLTASYVVGFNTAHIVDNAGTGSLITAEKTVVLDEENAMVPFYNGTAYVFTKVGFAIAQDDSYEGDGIKINALACPVDMEIVELLEDGCADNNIQIMIRLSWNTTDGTGYQEFVFTDEVAAAVYSSNNGTWNSYSQRFTMVITGFENVSGLSANVVVVSGTNVEYVSSNAVEIN